MKTFNIATSKKPTNFQAFVKAVQESAAEGGLTIEAYVVVEGRGCLNHGVMVGGDDQEAEKFIHQLTMVLMPARYCHADGDPAIHQGLFSMS